MTALKELTAHVEPGETLVFTLTYSPEDADPWQASSGPADSRLTAGGPSPTTALERLADRTALERLAERILKEAR